MRALAFALAASLGASGVGCASGSASPEAAAPRSPSETAPEGRSEERAQESDKGPSANRLYPAHEAVPPVAASCLVADALPTQTSCAEARAELAEALALDGTAQDSALSKLETCSEFPAGLIRALRAELGEAECADALVSAVVIDGAGTIELSSDIRETLVALALGARLRRLAQTPPVAPKEHSKEALDSYFKESLFPWITSQAQAIFAMASQGIELSGYARGIVAIEAGNADMRFVEIVRDAPLADEIAAHQEAKDLYFATLDEQLEPRKARGRNAALVGLREMARIGVRSSERVASARQLLSKVYGGRRVNALDALLVAELPPQKPATEGAAIASQVPASYSSVLIGTEPVTPNLTRGQLQMGMTVGMRRQIESSGDLISRLLLARGLFESGRTYFRAEDFQASQAILTGILDDKSGQGILTAEQRDEAILLRALSIALTAGPKDAAELIAQGPRFADALGNLALLDALSSHPGELGGRAAFNAGYLRELVAPSGDPVYWKDLAERYRSASRLLKGSEKKLAADREKACREIERAIKSDQRAASKKS